MTLLYVPHIVGLNTCNEHHKKGCISEPLSPSPCVPHLRGSVLIHLSGKGQCAPLVVHEVFAPKLGRDL
jgi:hypothetical protein